LVSAPFPYPIPRIAITATLAGPRFFDEADLVALDPRADESVRENPDVQPVVAYAGALRTLRELTEEFYRQTILGGGDPEEFENQVKAQAGPVLMAMGMDLEILPSDDELDALFDERFGARIMLGVTAGYTDLHMGHSVIDETRTVKQYGHEAELRFVALDSGEDLRLAFLAEFERTEQESSIFAHEGRHAIDMRLGTKMRTG